MLEETQIELQSCYHISNLNSNKPLKIWGIDPMSTPLAMAYVRLYANDGAEKQNFRKIELGGILTFIIDRKRRNKQLRLYDINEYKLIF